MRRAKAFYGEELADLSRAGQDKVYVETEVERTVKRDLPAHVYEQSRKEDVVLREIPEVPQESRERRRIALEKDLSYNH